ncbi:MAG: PAS domain S-box protein [Chitinophagaceae bacterium]|nr:PAS domain S-box protein [Chitinophagaceae bacterium]
MLKNNMRALNEFIFQNNSKNYSAATGIVVFLISMLAILGWEFDIQVFKRPIPELVAMNPMTALALTLSGISLLLLIKTPQKKFLFIFAKLLAIAALVIGALKLLAVITGFDVGVDHWLYNEKLASDIINNIPNGMAPNSAANLIFTGVALLLAGLHGKKAIFISNFFILLSAFISLLSIIGYTYGAHSFSDIRPFLPMAFHTAICFLLLAIGILCADSDKGFMAAITGPYRGGEIIQLLLPMAIFVPIAFGLLRLYGERNGLYSNSFGTALFATANIVIFVFLIFKTASSLNRSDKILMLEIEERKKIEKELKDSNIFLDTIFQNAPNMIFVKDAVDLRFVQINKDGEKLLGIQKKEIIGKNDYDLVPVDQANRITNVDRQLFENGVLLDIAEEKITTSKGDRWLHTKKIPVIDENGIPQYLVGIAEDITERKIQNDKIREFYQDLEQKVHQRTEELFKSEQRFKALLENSIDAISLADHEGAIIYQSPSVERLTGYSPEDRKNKQTLDFIHPADQRMGRKILSDLLLNPGASVPVIFRFLHKEGKYIWIEGTVTNLLSDKSVQAVVFNFRDITEKKLAEEALALSEEKYRLLFSSNPLPAWVFHIETLSFLEVNDAAIAHYGYSRNEFLNMTIRDIRPPEDINDLMAQRTKADRSSTAIYNGYWRHKKKTDEIISVEITSRHIDFKGHIARLVIAHDITDKVQAEQKLSLANETLSVRARELTASNKDLEQFAYVASHDLQEPLRMVSSFLQLLEKKYHDLLDETGKQYIHFAIDGSERMKRLILDLLAYSRAGTSKEISASIDVNEIAKDVASTFTFALEETGGEIVLENLPTIIAVKTQMYQLLQNLVSNAIKYRNKEAPRIEISCEERPSFWIFRVADNGLGIDERFFEKIFIIFQRLHNKTEYSGTGIGLAICKKIVERHGGSIHVESKPGIGSTFIFSIKKL